MSTLKTTYLQHPSSSTPNLELNADGTVTVLQNGLLSVASAYASTDQTVSSTSYVDLTSISVSVTPKSASSKFILMFTSAVEPQAVVAVDGQFHRDTTGLGELFTLITASTYDGFMAMNYVDSPNTTSSITYKMRVKVASNSAIFRSSSLVVIEVAG